MTKSIEDFFPDKDVKYLKEFGVDKIITILDSNDSDAKQYLLEILANNTVILGSYLKDNYKCKNSVNNKYKIDLLFTSQAYYRKHYRKLGVYSSLYNKDEIPNCFIDYIRNL